VTQKREQIKKPAPQERKAEPQVEPKTDAEAEKLKAETDELLDEIDGLLEDQRRGVRQGVRPEGRRVSTQRAEKVRCAGRCWSCGEQVRDKGCGRTGTPG
jgi:hypothetical protein